MRLATRTALAAFVAAFATLAITGAVFRGRFTDVLQDRVDAQLEDRAETAPILAAIAGRLSRSELVATVAPAQVLVDGELIRLGDVPGDALPPPSAPGWDTVVAAGDRWRLRTIEVVDVPDIGDRTLVQLAEPLGDVDAEVTALRRRLVLAGLVVSIAAGAVGWLLGGLATRPLSALRRDAGSLGDDDPDSWHVADRYGSPEVDDVAVALNANLRRLAETTVERERALAAARAFAASASHELRTPMQGALMNLDIARSHRADDDTRRQAVELAHAQVQRMAASLAAVRTLADAEFADPAWFEPVDLVELTEGVVADELRRHPDAVIEVVVDAVPGAVPLWRDGVQLAIANTLRNALVHGCRGGEPPRVTITVDGSDIVVDDDGPGIAEADRGRVVERFEKGSGSPGSGLGLAIAREVVVAHGGTIAIAASPAGGARVTLHFG